MKQVVAFNKDRGIAQVFTARIPGSVTYGYHIGRRWPNSLVKGESPPLKRLPIRRNPVMRVRQPEGFEEVVVQEQN